MGSLWGPRIDPGYYISHPNAAGSYWQNGCALDAGSAMVFDSNLNWLGEQSCRHLVANHGRSSTAPIVTNLVDTWVGVAGYDVPDPASVDTAHEISWQPTWTTCHGPLILLADRIMDNGTGVTVRDLDIHYHYKIETGLSSKLWLYAALTSSDLPPDLGGYWAISRAVDETHTGEREMTITLSASAALDAFRDGAPLTGRVTASDTRVQGRWLVGYLWIAAVTQRIEEDENPQNYLYAYDAYETR